MNAREVPPTNATEMNTIMFIILQQKRDNGGLKRRITGIQAYKGKYKQ